MKTPERWSRAWVIGRAKVLLLIIVVFIAPVILLAIAER